MHWLSLCCVTMNSTPESAVALLVGVYNFPSIDTLDAELCLRSVDCDKITKVMVKLVAMVLSVPSVGQRNQGKMNEDIAARFQPGFEDAMERYKADQF